MVKSSIKKNIINSLILSGFALALFYSAYNILFGNLLLSILSSIGLLVGLGFFIYFGYYFSYIKEYVTNMELEYRKREKVLKEIYHYFNGFNEKYSEKYSVYSKMVGSGVKLPVANAIINFAYEVTSKDTIFLIRLNHDENSYYLKIGGQPIYYQQAKDIFGQLREQCDVVASDNFIIWKEKSIDN
jgi:hypothetical protein